MKKWLKKEGEAFGEDEPICELSCSGISVELDPETAGIMIDRLAIEGVTVEVNKPIASYVLNKDAYMSYIESKHIAAEEAERMAEAKQVSSEKSKKPDNMVLMREIKHLMQAGHIQEGSGESLLPTNNSAHAFDHMLTDYAKTLQSLARRGDQELMDVFTASFDGVAFDKDSFDVSFFVDNTKELVKEKAGK